MANVNMPERITGDNSDKARKEGKNLPKAKPLANGEWRKKTLAMKFADVFFEGSVKDALKYVISEIAIPQVKGAIIEGFKFILYGGNNPKANGNGNNTPYNSYYIGRDGIKRPANNQSSSKKGNSELEKLKKEFDPKLIVVEDRGVAQDVLAELKNDCNSYGQIGVDRLFELVNITTDWTSTKYGWTKGDLDDAKVRQCSGGYWFDLPDPYPID